LYAEAVGSTEEREKREKSIGVNTGHDMRNCR
jgi:hypothetical protein